MNIADIFTIIGFTIFAVVIIGLLIFFVYLLLLDRNQKIHSILRNYPALGLMPRFIPSKAVHIPFSPQ
ncbi:hypothetical protein G6549_16265 [Bacillus sp. MM2020_1]|nr:hypothetical protein [Bacillus sp. MM2020_1]